MVARTVVLRVVLGATPAAPKALQERCDTGRRVDLNDAVEVTDVDAELERRRRNDHTVACLREGLLGLSAFVYAERSVGHERRRAVLAQGGSELLGTCSTVDESKSLLATMQARDDERGIRQAPDVVKRDIGGWRHGRGRVHDPARCLTTGSQPLHDLVGVADRCRERHTLELALGEVADAREDCKQMPAAVVSYERVGLVNDHHTEIRSHDAASTRVETSIDSSDSGVVSSTSGGSARRRDRCGPVTSPCQSPTRRPTSSA